MVDYAVKKVQNIGRCGGGVSGSQKKSLAVVLEMGLIDQKEY